MANLTYDKALSFGKMDPVASGQFPDVLNLGKAHAEDHYPGKEFTGAGRMTCDVCCNAPAGGTGITVTVEGSEDGSTNWTAVGVNSFSLNDMLTAPCQTAVSPNRFQYLRLSVAASGTFTGSAEAFLNTYAGK